MLGYLFELGHEWELATFLAGFGSGLGNTNKMWAAHRAQKHEHTHETFGPGRILDCRVKRVCVNCWAKSEIIGPHSVCGLCSELLSVSVRRDELCELYMTRIYIIRDYVIL